MVLLVTKNNSRLSILLVLYVHLLASPFHAYYDHERPNWGQWPGVHGHKPQWNRPEARRAALDRSGDQQASGEQQDDQSRASNGSIIIVSEPTSDSDTLIIYNSEDKLASRLPEIVFGH